MERACAGERLRPLAVGERIWGAFWEMDAVRKFQVGMAVAYMPIGHDGIAHYQQAHGVALERWERRAILDMDRPRLAHLNKPEEERGASHSTVSEQGISPALVQALFG